MWVLLIMFVCWGAGGLVKDVAVPHTFQSSNLISWVALYPRSRWGSDDVMTETDRGGCLRCNNAALWQGTPVVGGRLVGGHVSTLLLTASVICVAQQEKVSS